MIVPGRIRSACQYHHLRVLLEAGLIETRKDGQFVYIKANPQTIEEYTEALSALCRKKEKVNPSPFDHYI
jgi:DNA-binding transcriptional ArsR family regulator